MLLFPLDGKESSGSVKRAMFKPFDKKRKELVPVNCHQWRVLMRAHVVAKDLKSLAAESSDICVELSRCVTFKWSAIDQELGGDQCIGFPVCATLREMEESRSLECCFAENVQPAGEEHVSLANIPHMRYIAAYVTRMMQFQCDAPLVEFRLGVRDKPGEPGVKQESPLMVTFTYAPGTPAQFAVKMWLAPEFEVVN